MTPNYKQGAIDYLDKLAPEFVKQLYTKPFAIGPTARVDCAERFHDFANLITILQLDSPRKILDVGCGPGWLSEYLARLGHKVTGVDICPGMIDIARKRIESIRFTAGDRELSAEFLVQDIEHLELDDTFHVAILYDTLHHFEDRPRILRRLLDVLKDGGRILIHEGVKPPSGSEAEKYLREVMEKYETRETPMAHRELLDLLRECGYVGIVAYTAVNGVFENEAEALAVAQRHVREQPRMNIIVARKPRGDLATSDDPGQLGARIHVLHGPETMAPGELVELAVRVENTGDTIWLSREDECGGFVALGSKLLTKKGDLVTDAISWSLLAEDVAPDDFADLAFRFTAPENPGEYVLSLDMVDVSIVWFSDRGSPTTDHAFRVVAGK